MCRKNMLVLGVMLVFLASTFFLSCERESVFQPATNESEYVSLYEATDSPNITPREMGDAHGEIVRIFMHNLFNEKLAKDKTLKREFMKNGGLNTENFMEVMLLSVNQYMESRGEKIRMTSDDFKEFTQTVIRPLYENGIDLIGAKKCESDDVKSLLEKMCSENIISEQTLYRCTGLVDRTESSLALLNPIDARTVLQLPLDPNGPGEETGQIFEEILVNSAETWLLLEIDSSWIMDPELQAWWDWFRNSEKGKTIGALLVDGIGGIVFTGISAGNPYIGIIGGVGSSIAFAAWACDGPLPW